MPYWLWQLLIGFGIATGLDFGWSGRGKGGGYFSLPHCRTEEESLAEVPIKKTRNNNQEFDWGAWGPGGGDNLFAQNSGMTSGLFH